MALYQYKNLRNCIDLFATSWIILSTGSLFFCIFNMELSMFTLLGISLLYLFCSPKGYVGKQQVYTLVVILGIVVINCLLNIEYLSLNKDIIILLMRLFSLTLICSNLAKENFMKNFCEILFFLCCLSLVCFFVSELGYALPGERELWFKEKYYIYTFYHTVGRWFPFHRNAGVFWESPAFAIFINTAILFLMLGNNVGITGKKKAFYLLIYATTIFTTLSTLAYLEFILCVCATVFKFWGGKNQNSNNKNMKYITIILLILLLVVLAVVESELHIIEHKLINRQGSFVERSNDSIETLKLALQRPFAGFGLFNDYTRDALYQVDVKNNSNGFLTMILYLGFPISILYYGYAAYRLKCLFKCNYMSYLCILGAFLIFLNSEQISTMTLFLFYLFPLKEKRMILPKK